MIIDQDFIQLGMACADARASLGLGGKVAS